jgi:TetR/AcrR family transcriptional regulator
MRRHDQDSPESQPPPSGKSAGASRPERGAKRERSAALSQERILDAAEQEFAAHGFAGARLREIAVGAGIQPALIHHYFADKHGLYEAVIRRAADQMSTASWRVLETAKGVEDIVRGFIDVMVDFSVAHQKLLAIMRSEVLSGAGVLVEIVREKTHTLLEAVVDIVKNLQGAGELRDDVEPREMVRAGLSLVLYPIVDAPVLEMLLPEDASHDSSSERRKRVIADLLLSGIRKPR